LSLRWGAILGTAGGALAGAGLAVGRMRNFEQDEVDDRAYRISQNRGQVRLDHLSSYSAAAGFFGGLLIFRTPIAGACVGLAAGPLLVGAERLGVKFPELPDSSAAARDEAKRLARAAEKAVRSSTNGRQ